MHSVANLRKPAFGIALRAFINCLSQIRLRNTCVPGRHAFVLAPMMPVGRAVGAILVDWLVRLEGQRDQQGTEKEVDFKFH